MNAESDVEIVSGPAPEKRRVWILVAGRRCDACSSKSDEERCTWRLNYTQSDIVRKKPCHACSQARRLCVVDGIPAAEQPFPTNWKEPAHTAFAFRAEPPPVSPTNQAHAPPPRPAIAPVVVVPASAAPSMTKKFSMTGTKTIVGPTGSWNSRYKQPPAKADVTTGKSRSTPKASGSSGTIKAGLSSGAPKSGRSAAAHSSFPASRPPSKLVENCLADAIATLNTAAQDFQQALAEVKLRSRRQDMVIALIVDQLLSPGIRAEVNSHCAVDEFPLPLRRRRQPTGDSGDSDGNTRRSMSRTPKRVRME